MWWNEGFHKTSCVKIQCQIQIQILQRIAPFNKLLKITIAITITAPWCSHCKKLAPVLDTMASYLSGRIAIGKIDCTVEENLCQKQFEIRGYPTLKISRDGDFFEYPGKRDPDSIITFAEKMSEPAVTLVHNHQEASDVMQTSSTGVMFLAYDPKAKEVSKNTAKDKGGDELTLVEKYLASTNTVQVFGQVARKVQDKATFALLHPDSKDQLAFFGLAHASKSAFIAKIENDVAPMVYEHSGVLNSMDFMDFVKSNNVALVTDLQSHNFRSVAHLGKPLFIAVVDDSKVGKDDVMTKCVTNLRNFAKGKGNGKDVKDDYKFATMDGVKWSKFLKQFSIEKSALPQYLILDVPKRKFYQNETFPDIDAFIQGVKDGSIEERDQVMDDSSNPFERFHAFFVKYLPYTMTGFLLLVGLMFYFLLQDDEEELRYQEMLKAQRERMEKRIAEGKKKAMKED